MNLTKYEQETIVNYNNGDKIGTIYTADPVVIRKLTKLIDAYPEDYKLIRKNDFSLECSFPKKLIQFRKPIHLTQEQKEKAALNFKKNLES